MNAMEKWTPFVPLSRRQVSPIETLWSQPGLAMSPWLEMGWPQTTFSLSENESEYVVNLMVPGFSREELTLTVQGQTLSVSGEKRQEQKEKNRFAAGQLTFARQLRLPGAVQASQSRADLQNGVLTVSLPKQNSRAETAHHITVSQKGPEHTQSEKWWARLRRLWPW